MNDTTPAPPKLTKEQLRRNTHFSIARLLANQIMDGIGPDLDANIWRAEIARHLVKAGKTTEDLMPTH